MLVEVKASLRTAMLMLVLYLTLENIRWLLSGLLTSAGDTFYLLVSGALSIWIFMLLPTYLFVVRPKAPIETTFYIWIFYCIMSASLLLFRFWQGKWKKKHLIALDSEGETSSTPSQNPTGEVGNDLFS